VSRVWAAVKLRSWWWWGCFAERCPRAALVAAAIAVFGLAGLVIGGTIYGLAHVPEQPGTQDALDLIFGGSNSRAGCSYDGPC
jgi:hypothetical protein